MSRHEGRPPRLPGMPMHVCPPDQDPAETALRLAESTVAEAGWDGPPALFVLYQKPDGVVMGRPPLRQSLLKLHPVELFAALGTVVDRLAWLSNSPGDLYAIILVHEAWMITARDGTEEMRQAESDAEQRRIWKRPDRVEIRQASLVAVDGRQLGLSRRRGEDPLVVDSSSWEGTVPEAIRQFVTAAVG